MIESLLKYLNIIEAYIIESHSDDKKCYIIYRYGKFYYIDIYDGFSLFSRKYKTYGRCLTYGKKWIKTYI